jgi:flavin reductase (DIM6/NTAB) family NADH-FMN oxidoreductase RutF
MNKISISPERRFCPQPMYIIGTFNENKTPNFCVMTWIEFNMNGSPHLILGIEGEKRTKDNIIRTKQFSANLVSQNILKLADYFGNIKGNVEKKDKIKYEYMNGDKTNTPILEESKFVFECSVEKTIKLEGSEIFISKIINIQIDEKLKNMNWELMDLIKLDPVIYAPYNYYSIKEKIGNCGEWEIMK